MTVHIDRGPRPDAIGPAAQPGVSEYLDSHQEKRGKKRREARWQSRRAGSSDRKRVDENGNRLKVPSAAQGDGSRWRAWYVDDAGSKRAQSFGRKTEGQSWPDRQGSDQLMETWTDQRFRVCRSGRSRSGDHLRSDALAELVVG